jgi:hypothetical protein
LRRNPRPPVPPPPSALAYVAGKSMVRVGEAGSGCVGGLLTPTAALLCVGFWKRKGCVYEREPLWSKPNQGLTKS